MKFMLSPAFKYLVNLIMTIILCILFSDFYENGIIYLAYVVVFTLSLTLKLQ